MSYCSHPKCSKPLLPILKKWHHFLCSKSNLYHSWHHHPHHKHVHLGIAAISLVTAISFIFANLIVPIQQASAATATWNFQGDNSQYSYDNTKISTDSGNATLVNPGDATGATTNLNPKTGVSSDASAHFSSANKEYLTIPSNESLQTGDIDFEVGAWVRLDSKTTMRYFQCKWGTSLGEYLLRYNNSSDRFEFLIGSGITSNLVSASSLGSPSTNTLYFVRGWYDKTESKIKIQVNNGGINEQNTTITPLVQTGVPLFLGARPDATTTGFMDGIIDSPYFKKGISTPDEATALYNSGAGRTYNQLTSINGLSNWKSNLVSWWDLNEESGTRYDAHGTNHLNPAAAQIIAPPVYGSELVQNPGFESDFTNWSQAPNNGVIAITTTAGEFHSGAKAAKITQGASGIPYISSQFSVVPGQTYYYALWTRGDGTNAGRYGIRDITNSVYIIGGTSTGITGTGYTLISGSFTAPTGCVLAQIQLWAPSSEGGTAYFDDISVKQITTPAINNGGFETVTGTNTFTGWTNSVAGTSTINDETTTPYAGAHAVRLDVDASASNAQITQTSLVVGKKYKISLYAKVNDATGNPALQFNWGGSTNINQVLTTSYVQYTQYFIAEGTTLTLRRGTGTTNSKSIYLDQVTLESVGPTSDAGIAAGVAVDGNFAAGFNGTNQSLFYAGTVLDVGTNDFSVSGNFYLDNMSSAHATLFSAGSNGSASQYYWCYVNPDGTIRVEFNDGSGTYTGIASSAGVVVPNNWYHFAINFSRSGNATIYLNNFQVAQASISGKATAINTGNFYIGRYAGTGLYYLPGRIDGIGFTKRILTTQEITALYNNGKGLKYSQLPDSIKNDSNLKGFWNLDEKSGTRYDSTANANNLTDNGGVTQARGVNYFEGVVSKVLDLSSNGNTFTQTNPFKRPAYDSLGINNAPAVLFDGVDDSLVKTGDIIGTGDVTITTVIRARGWGGTNAGRIIDNSKVLLSLNGLGRLQFSSDAGTTTVTTQSASMLIVVINQNSNPSTVTYSIYNETLGMYLNTDGTNNPIETFASYAAWGGANGVINSGLNPVTSYTYSVRAKNSGNYVTSSSSTGSATTLDVPPSSPTNVTIGTITNSGFTVTWSDGSSNETGFKVFISTTPNTNCSLAVYPATPSFNLAQNTTTQAVTGKSVNTQYCAKIIASNTTGDSTPAYSSAKYTLANVPSNLTLTAVSSNQIRFVFAENGNSLASTYAVYNETLNKFVNQASGNLQDSADWQTFASWGGASGILSNGLSPNAQYTYKVKARNGDNVETALTSGTSRYTLANIPALTATANWDSTNSYHLSAAIQSNLNPAGTSYYIQYSTDNVTFVDPYQVAWQTSDTYLFNKTNTNTNLSPNTQYWLKVKAKNAENVETQYSTAVSDVTPPAAPTNLQSTNICASTASASWIASVDATSYTFSYGTDANATNLGESTLAATAKNLSDLSLNQTYYYKVKATNQNGTGAWSSVTSFTTDHCIGATAPTDFNGTATSSTSINWTWSDSADENGYRVHNSSHTSLSGDLAIDSTNWTENSLVANTAYTRHVNSYNNAGNNDSNQDTVYTLANTPGVPTVTTVSSSSLRITINTNSNPNNTRYAIFNETLNKYVRTTGDLQDNPDWQYFADWGGASGILNTGLNPNTSYFYKVKALNGDNVETALSAAGSASTLRTYTVTVSNAGNGSGTTSVTNTTVDEGSNLSITATPAISSNFTSFTGCDSAVNEQICLLSNIVSSKNITATFTLKTFTITTSREGDGDITPSTVVNYGTNSEPITIVTPETSYLADVVVDGQSRGKITTWQFTNVIENHTIHVIFKLNPSATLSINSNAAKTNQQQVSLAITPNAVTTEMKLSLLSDFDGASYEPILTTKSFSLCGTRYIVDTLSS